ncbi:MAG: type IV secretory system conjugative DNA transfer family protein [Spirochaetaceae bacterium]|jgi:type IV secretion system protein VirD4|nr:type IV secretory system conjugative DNA transfer family protein [Spirochaetaceae bacterium]
MSGNEFLRGKPTDVSGEQALSFLFKIITLLIIICGLQAAAQKFAFSVRYEVGLVGRPEGIIHNTPVYPFWNLFIWTLKLYKRTEIHALLYAAWKTAIYTSIVAVGFYVLLEFVLIRNRKQNIFGTARWARNKDLEKAGLLGRAGGIIIGQTADAKLNVKYDTVKNSVIMHLKKPARKIIQAGIYNTLLTAPTRAGKGVSNVIPTLLSYSGSMIVLDFKGENFNLTSGFRKRFGTVYRWEPTGEKGHHFNPMEEIRGGEDAFSDANLIADILTTPASGGGSATSDHFQTGAKALLTGVILHCLCCPDWKHKSLPGVSRFLAEIDEEDPNNTKYIYDLMINGYHGDPAIHQAVVKAAVTQRARPDNEGGSMLSTVNNALAVFEDAKIKRNTSDSEFYIDEFVETDVPITLYITVQYSDVDRISALIRMFILLFSRWFTGGETQATNRKFKVPLLFVLDEFDKLGRMDELERNMGIHNGFGIHYFLIFQSLNQLNKIYTKDHSFLAHCRNSIFFAPGAGELESAELISKICGRESISKANISYSGSRGALGYNSNSISAQDQERNLINADEIIKLPLDSFILVCQGLPPYIGKKNVYYEDVVFTSRMEKNPAFSTREEAAKIAESTVKKIKARRWFEREAPAKEKIESDERAVEMDDAAVSALMEKYLSAEDVEKLESSGVFENETVEEEIDNPL